MIMSDDCTCSVVGLLLTRAHQASTSGHNPLAAAGVSTLSPALALIEDLPHCSWSWYCMCSAGEKQG